MSKAKNNNTTSSSSSSSSSISHFQAIATSSNITRPNLTADDIQRELNEKLFEELDEESINERAQDSLGEDSLTVIKNLIEQGANVNAVDIYGDTTLHKIARFEYPEIVELLLQKGADVNAVNNYGETALHGPAQYSHAQNTLLLLQNGANPSARDNNGRTPLDLAENNDDIRYLDDNNAIRSLLTNCINFQEELKSIFDKMVKSFSEIRAARNGKEEVSASASASNPQTDLDETLKAALETAKNSFLEDSRNLLSRNINLFPSGFNPLNMALDDKSNSVFHLIANEALKRGNGSKRDQYLELLVTLAKENGSEKIQEMITRATTISEGFRPKEKKPLVVSDIEEIIVSYLHDNEIERKKERAQASQSLEELGITGNVNQTIINYLQTMDNIEANIDANLATALHLAANKGFFSNSINSNQISSSNCTSSGLKNYIIPSFTVQNLTKGALPNKRQRVND